MTENEVIAALDNPVLGLDGKWSSQTKSLMAQLGAQKLELNKWWALTRQNWTCPSCKKPKRELAKLSRSKCLIAKLVSHHDHSNELVEAHAPVVWLPDDSREPTAYALREHLKGIAKGFLSRFPPTIICEGCNNLEPDLKKRLGIPCAVTLMPLEIGKLGNYDRATLDPNLENLISQLVEWADFSEKHIGLAKQSFRLDLHPAKKDWFNSEVNVKSRAVSEILSKFQERTYQKVGSVEEFLFLSVAKSEAPSSKQVKLPTPTKVEFMEFKHPSPMRQKVIDMVPDNWSCPICRRSKFECFASSRSKTKKFMLNLFGKTITFDFGQVEETGIICGNCNDFHNGLVRHCGEKGVKGFQEFLESGKINVEAARQGIKSAAHQRHEVDFTAAIACLIGPFGLESDIDFETDF